MSGPEWGPPLDWDAPLDGETTEEMITNQEVRRIEEEAAERRNALLWNEFIGYYGRDGQIVIRPPRRSE